MASGVSDYGYTIFRSQVPGNYHRLTKEENFLDTFETKTMLGLKTVDNGHNRRADLSL